MATIKESIKVVAVFDNGIKPAKFKWKNRVYKVEEIAYTWVSRDGSQNIIHFSVTDGATLFELAYNQSTMKWSLEQTA
ncbi:MAG: hypothetical protein HYS21_12375 [Deltaproteobacteria bacterium]|nr:hypothetical protein [Deltaproteobacteria bacterium]